MAIFKVDGQRGGRFRSALVARGVKDIVTSRHTFFLSLGASDQRQDGVLSESCFMDILVAGLVLLRACYAGELPVLAE